MIGVIGLGHPGHVVDPPPPQFDALEIVNEIVLPTMVVLPKVDSTLSVELPIGNRVAGVSNHIPLAVAVVVPRIVPEAFRRVIVAPELPLPERLLVRDVCPQASDKLDTSVIVGTV